MSRYSRIERSRSPSLHRDRFYADRSISPSPHSSVRSVIVAHQNQSRVSRHQRTYSPVENRRRDLHHLQNSSHLHADSSIHRSETHRRDSRPRRADLSPHRHPSTSAYRSSSRRPSSSSPEQHLQNRMVSRSIFDRLDDSNSAAAYVASSRQSTTRRVALIVDPASPFIVHPHEDARGSRELQERNLRDFQARLSYLRSSYDSSSESSSTPVVFTVQIPVAEFPRSVTHGDGKRGGTSRRQ